jgi:hypothetical protein
MAKGGNMSLYAFPTACAQIPSNDRARFVLRSFDLATLDSSQAAAAISHRGAVMCPI